MYDPRKHGATFGSELRRRQTPKLAHRKRQSILVGAVLLLGTSIAMIVQAMGAIRTGTLVHVGRPGGVAVTGYEEGAIALLAIAFCVLALWKSGRSGESVGDET